MSHDKGIATVTKLESKVAMALHDEWNGVGAWASLNDRQRWRWFVMARVGIAAYLAEAQPTSEGEEREAFEAWAQPHFEEWSFERDDDDQEEPCGEYISASLQVAWLAWQARSAREGGKR